ncbi:MAG TPA: hypothetical protein VF638_03055 [Sphingomonas sp.]|jgi:hypothetical protein
MASTPLNGSTETQEERLDRLRGVFSVAVTDIAERLMEELILGDDKAKLCLDMAQFTTYLMAIKITEARLQEPAKDKLLAAYWPMAKALKDEVPDMLREYAARAAGGAASNG